MILQAPGSLVNFFQQYVPAASPYVPRRVLKALRPLMAGLILATNSRRSLTAVGAAVVSGKRHKSTVSRLLKRSDLRSRDLHWGAVERVLKRLAPKMSARARRRDWLLALDGTAVQRGAHTKIKGGITTERTSSTRRKKGAPRKRAPGDKPRSPKKKRKTKYHTFLVASLTTHEGVRVPLPRYTCDPKDFKRRGRPKSVKDTQIDLAKVLIKRVKKILPVGVRLVVVADAYFECEKLYSLSHREDFVLITPTDSSRCFADETTPSKSNGHRIWNRGRHFPPDSFSRLDLHRGSEDTARFRRHSARKSGPKDRRTYWLRHESRTVAKLGAVGIVYSWKTPIYDPKPNFRKKGFKILLCSDPTWTGEKIVEYYECRWTAIEILIRELKQHLGFGHYTGQSLEALERWIDLVLMSFLYLEVERHRLLTDASPPAVREKAASARTLGMQELVRAEASTELMRAITQSYRSERKKRLVTGFFAAIIAETDANRVHACS